MSSRNAIQFDFLSQWPSGIPVSVDNTIYDVFISFRGEDTRASFTSHLYASLQNAGITVFKDDKSLPRGVTISDSLSGAIERSHISVVVFSRNYADSRWCLMELEKIMECHRTIRHVVVPVFYDVDPSEVRHQTGHFGKAFQNLLNRILKEKGEKWPVLEWREALRLVDRDIGGVDLNSSREREIADAINRLVPCLKWGVSKAAGIQGAVLNSREMEMANHEIDLLVKRWREALLCEAAGISGAAVLNSSVIEILVNCWREELRKAAGTYRFAVINPSGNLDNGITVTAQHWTEALCEAAGISGVVVLNSRNEVEAIKNIVENVTHLLNKTELFIADNPVGVEPRVQDMIQLLDYEPSNDVLLLGMWGMGGIGKTTIAKAIYNKIGRNFEGRSFLANIREIWEQDDGRFYLQEQLLFDIYKERKTKIRNVESGKNILKETLCHKKVLLVLDDVNELDQLNALCGSRTWFGLGSRIIITTRDKHILRGSRVDKVYTMKGMDESESIELFSWHAFKQATPREDFTELSRNVITYSGGLPLSLEVLGSYLFDMDVIEWESVLEKLKIIPNDQVQKKLKISYDGLNDDTEKEIFLDIAFFFIGMDRNDVTQILNGCGLFAANGIRVLIERSLVTVDDKNKLGMHDLLRDMGREIIRAKSPKVPEERSRLWFHEDVLDVLSNETGTKAIEGLGLKLPRTNTKCLSIKAFENMRKLRLLQLGGVQLVGDFKCLSKNLRWLCWHGFHLPYIPTNFYQGSLVSIELENSSVKHVWKEAQLMEKLKILNLSHCHFLTQTPDFSYLPNLEKLVLIDCRSLSEVSDTIGYLKKVLLINLKDCISLYKLPRSIYKLKSLKTLILSGCLKIDNLEEDLEQMESLTILVADKTAITQVPFSIIRSKSIGYISLCGYEGSSHNVFPSIILSWLSPTSSLSSNVQTFVGMSSVVSLDVVNSSSHNLFSISKDLPKLQTLWVECGSEFQLSQDAKCILDALYAMNSKELESIATTSQILNMNALASTECSKQVHISGSKSSLRCLLFEMGMNCQVTHIMRQSNLQNMTTSEHGGCLLPGDSYPDWFTFNNEGSSVIFEIPHVNGRNMKTMMYHVHYSSLDNITSDGLKTLMVKNHTKATIMLYKRDALASFQDEEWQRLLSNIESGNKVEIVVVFGSRLIVNMTTVYLIYEPMDEKMEHCHAPNKNVVVSNDAENLYAIRSISPQVESMDDSKQIQKRRKLE